MVYVYVTVCLKKMPIFFFLGSANRRETGRVGGWEAGWGGGGSHWVAVPVDHAFSLCLYSFFFVIIHLFFWCLSSVERHLHFHRYILFLGVVNLHHKTKDGNIFVNPSHHILSIY